MDYSVDSTAFYLRERINYSNVVFWWDSKQSHLGAWVCMSLKHIFTSFPKSHLHMFWEHLYKPNLPCAIVLELFHHRRKAHRNPPWNHKLIRKQTKQILLPRNASEWEEKKRKKKEGKSKKQEREIVSNSLEEPFTQWKSSTHCLVHPLRAEKYKPGTAESEYQYYIKYKWRLP